MELMNGTTGRFILLVRLGVWGKMCVHLRGVQGVGEDGADRSLSRRQTGVFSGMLVFLSHLGGTWSGGFDILKAATHTHSHKQEHVQHVREQMATITHKYWQSGKASLSFSLPASRLFFQPRWLHNMINGPPPSPPYTHTLLSEKGQSQ